MNSQRTRRHSVIVVQTIIPDYRLPFVEALNERLGNQLVLVSGTEDWTTDVAHVRGAATVEVRNRYFAGRQLLWQSSVLRSAVAADVTVLLLNPRVASTWLVLAARRLLKRRTLLWGHAWPRHGRGSHSDRIRGLMRRFADTLIVYTEQEARELRDGRATIDVAAAPNALYRARDMTPSQDECPTDFLYVGRLNDAKKPLLLLEAFREALPSMAKDVRLVFFGDGPLREELRTRVDELGLDDRVVLRGHVSDVMTLRQAYGSAIVSVSPGYVGLSLIQSLGNGVAMLVARDEPHAPEIEAIVDGVNGLFFDSDSPEALASALCRASAERETWASRRVAIAEHARSTYSVERMADSFVAALGLGGESYANPRTGASSDVVGS